MIPAYTSQPDLQVQIIAAAALLDAGGVVAFPTETVYGLGADISHPDAVDRIFRIKGRPTNHPLIVHISSCQDLPYWSQDIPEAAWKLATHFWPGPLTLILQRSRHIPLNVTGGQETVGLRVPDHPVALDLLQHGTNDRKRALAAPSANRFGHISPTTAAHVREELGEAVDMILDGGHCTVGLESTIVGFHDQTVTLLRPGGISLAALEAVLGTPVTLSAGISTTTRVSGSLASHYAPDTPLEVLSAAPLQQRAAHLVSQGSQVAVMARSSSLLNSLQGIAAYCLAMPETAPAYGSRLYAILRQLDRQGFDCILAESPPAGTDWLAVADRLQRASHGTSQDRTATSHLSTHSLLL